MVGELPPLIVILGPTAVGKTGLAIHLAKQLGGEIIGADSRQVYRYMDIGTAKPTPDQQQAAVHHLIDIVDPDYSLSLAEYQDMAFHRIDAIHERGHIPLLVGGTGQYITAIVEGWSIPRVPPDLELRAELEAFAEEQGKEALHARLLAVDPVAAGNIHPNNVRRVVRSLEVHQVTGEPISTLQQKKPPPYHILVYGLQMDRASLYPRADQRVDEMIESGLVDEVQELLDKGYDRRLPSMSGLGYAQITEHLLDRLPLEEAIRKTKTATHNFIRGQDVWFRGHNHGILWHNVEELETERFVEDVQQSFERQT